MLNHTQTTQGWVLDVHNQVLDGQCPKLGLNCLLLSKTVQNCPELSKTGRFHDEYLQFIVNKVYIWWWECSKWVFHLNCTLKNLIELNIIKKNLIQYFRRTQCDAVQSQPQLCPQYVHVYQHMPLVFNIVYKHTDFDLINRFVVPKY